MSTDASIVESQKSTQDQLSTNIFPLAVEANGVSREVLQREAKNQEITEEASQPAQKTESNPDLEPTPLPKKESGGICMSDEDFQRRAEGKNADGSEMGTLKSLFNLGVLFVAGPCNIIKNISNDPSNPVKMTSDAAQDLGRVLTGQPEIDRDSEKTPSSNTEETPETGSHPKTYQGYVSPFSM